MILETDRLYVRKLALSDASRMSEYRNKEEVARFQSWKSYSEDDALRRIQQCLRISLMNQPKTDYHLAIICKDNDKMIGDIFVEIMTKKVMCLGYTLDSEYWNHGYASEVVSAFCEYMNHEYGLKKVVCYVYSDNKRSIRMLKKLGFHKFEESYFYGDEGYMKNLSR